MTDIKTTKESKKIDFVSDKLIKILGKENLIKSTKDSLYFKKMKFTRTQFRKLVNFLKINDLKFFQVKYKEKPVFVISTDPFFTQKT